MPQEEEMPILHPHAWTLQSLLEGIEIVEHAEQ
jgi:hypothetical protein